MPPRIALSQKLAPCPSCFLPTRFFPQPCSARNHPPKSRSIPTRPITVRTTPTATSTTSTPNSTTTVLPSDSQIPSSTHALHDPTVATPTATFTTLGATPTLLSISLSASQPLHTRRGTLLSFSGPPHHTTSTLSPLQPFRRAALGLPFLYQRLTATSPTTFLLTSPSAGQSFTILSLDGRLDWRVLRPQSLVAWAGSGSSLSFSTNISTQTPGVKNWTQQTVTGRGLVAVAVRGGGYEVKIREGEESLIHPSHIVAYSISGNTPTPYRLAHTRLRLAIPSLGQYLPDTQFVKAVRESKTFLFLGRVLFRIRQWLRVALWGERVFLRFRGPGSVVVQGRAGGFAGGVRDRMEEREVNEWADMPAGSVQKSVTAAERSAREGDGSVEKKGGVRQEEHVTYATIGKDGKVAWTKD